MCPKHCRSGEKSLKTGEGGNGKIDFQFIFQQLLQIRQVCFEALQTRLVPGLESIQASILR